jgi:hypothetical protein
MKGEGSLANRIDTREGSRPATIALVAASLGLTALWAVCGCSTDPVADGPTLLKERCSTCHSPERGQTTSKTREEWSQTLTRMVGKGAKVNGAEQAVLVEYLAKITAR